MFQEDHGVEFFKRRSQPARIVGGGWHHHLQPRRVGEPTFQALRMLAATRSGGTKGGAHNHWHRDPPAGHQAKFCHVVTDLIHGIGHKIDKLELGHRTQPRQRHAHRPDRQ